MEEVVCCCTMRMAPGASISSEVCNPEIHQPYLGMSKWGWSAWAFLRVAILSYSDRASRPRRSKSTEKRFATTAKVILPLQRIVIEKAISFLERQQEERGENLNFAFEAGRNSQPSVRAKCVIPTCATGSQLVKRDENRFAPTPTGHPPKQASRRRQRTHSGTPALENLPTRSIRSHLKHKAWRCDLMCDPGSPPLNPGDRRPTTRKTIVRNEVT